MVKLALKNNIKDLKAPLYYVCPDLTKGIAYAHYAGEIKYAPFNFKNGHKLTELLDAMQRHIDCIRLGEDIDADATDKIRNGGTNSEGTVYPPRIDTDVVVKHLDCIGANLNMILWQTRFGTLVDNRDIYLGDEL